MWRDRLIEAYRSLLARPLLVLAAGVYAGIGLALYWNTVAAWLVTLALVGFALCGLLAIWVRSARLVVALFAGAFLLGVVRTLMIAGPPDSPDHIIRLADAGPTRIEATVVQAPERGAKSTQVLLDAYACTHEGRRFDCHGRLMLFVRKPGAPWLAGQRVRASVRLSRFYASGNPGDFDYPAYMARRGVYVRAFLREPSGLVVLGTAKPVTLRHRIEQLRTRFARFVDQTLATEPATLAKALTVGMRKQIPEPVRQAFLASGTAHVLAISGLHIGVMALWVFWLVRFLWRRFHLGMRYVSGEQAAALLTIPVVWGYALLAGLQVSTLRAAVMICVFLVGQLLRRRSDSLSSLALAALVVLLIWPQAMDEVGFKLSFLSVLGIIVGTPRVMALWPARLQALMAGPGVRAALLRYLGFLVATSLVTFLACLPVIVNTFHVLSWSGLILNLIIVPMFGLIVIPAYGIALALWFVSPTAAGWLLQFASLALAQAVDLQVAVEAALGGFVWQPGLSAGYCAAFWGVMLLTAALLPPGDQWRGEPKSALLDRPRSLRLRALAGGLALGLMMSALAWPVAVASPEADTVFVLQDRGATIVLMNSDAIWQAVVCRDETKNTAMHRDILTQSMLNLGRRRIERVWTHGERLDETATWLHNLPALDIGELVDASRRVGCKTDAGILRCASARPGIERLLLPAIGGGLTPVLRVRSDTRELIIAVDAPALSEKAIAALTTMAGERRQFRKRLCILMGMPSDRVARAVFEHLQADEVIVSLTAKQARRISRRRWQALSRRYSNVYRSDRAGALRIDANGEVVALGHH